MITISKNLLDTVNFDTNTNRFFSSVEYTEFYNNPGAEHYRLLAYLSTLFNNKEIIDIGTLYGSSALALAYNKNNIVYTFDIIDKLSFEQKTKKWTDYNIHYNVKNLWDINNLTKWEKIILNSSIILIDIDPHEGNNEYFFYSWLKSKYYTGLLICDDIYLSSGMKCFWNFIPESEKCDVTKFGHFSGTGIIHFGHTTINLT